MSKLLTVNEAAGSLGLAPVTLRAWIAQRRIGVVRLGARYVFRYRKSIG